MTTTFTASASFSLTDANGVTLFSYSPSFTSSRNTTAHALYAGEHLAQTGNSQLECGSDLNVDRIYAFIKNVDSDYAVTVLPDSGQNVEISHLKPGEFVFAPMDLNADGSGTSLRVTAATADQKVQYLIVDAIDN
tara:strand:- start:2368 stop:2772 length:405 start_codon:yes stop_codon:yes gene_type:complete